MGMSFGELRVLVVDDIAMTRDLIAGFLKHSGVGQVLKAGGGREAFDLVVSTVGLVNIVLCDWNMPDMNGLDLMREVRKSQPAMPFVFITGRDDVASLMAAKAAGVDAYLLKPVSPQQLREKLEYAAEKIAS